MKQPDNHIDSLNKILRSLVAGFTGGLLSQLSKDGINTDHHSFKKARQKLDQYYADFYRNKILEAKIDELKDIPTGTSLEAVRLWVEGRGSYLTAQSQSTKQER